MISVDCAPVTVGSSNPISDLLAPISSASDVRKCLLKQYKHLDLNGFKQCYVYGAGQDARDFIETCHKENIKILGVFDDNQSKWGQPFVGYTIQSLQSFKEPGPHSPLVITTHRVAIAAKRLGDLGIASYVPVWALQILNPDRFLPQMYYKSWAEDLAENKDKYIALWDLFADETSRRVYKAFIEFRLRFDSLVLLENIDAADEYFPKGVIELTDHEVFVDGGAWIGDSIRSLKQRVNDNYTRAYAFEPSPATYETLVANFTDDPRVVTINKGIHSKSMVIRFDEFNSSASRISEQGSTEIPVTTIDEVVGSDNVSFIKMNIEGAEAEALKGARKTIRTHKPKMAICVYHNPRDTWELTDLIQEITSGYDFYIRQHDGGIIQLVVYAIPSGS